MRTIVVLAGFGLAASMATADIKYYDSMQNPYVLISDWDNTGFDFVDRPQTFFDVTKSPSEQGGLTTRSIMTEFLNPGSDNFGGISLGGPFDSPSDVEVLSGLGILLFEGDDPLPIQNGLIYRIALAEGTSIPEYQNTDPMYDLDTTDVRNEVPLVDATDGTNGVLVTGLMGVRLNLPSGTHHGWFELVSVPDPITGGQLFAVSRWAWNDTPGGGILAGQVPAPGAMVVLGVGGLAATRRRR